LDRQNDEVGFFKLELSAACHELNSCKSELAQLRAQKKEDDELPLQNSKLQQEVIRLQALLDKEKSKTSQLQTRVDYVKRQFNREKAEVSDVSLVARLAMEERQVAKQESEETNELMRGMRKEQMEQVKYLVEENRSLSHLCSKVTQAHLNCDTTIDSLQHEISELLAKLNSVKIELVTVQQSHATCGAKVQEAKHRLEQTIEAHRNCGATIAHLTENVQELKESHQYCKMDIKTLENKVDQATAVHASCDDKYQHVVDELAKTRQAWRLTIAEKDRLKDNEEDMVTSTARMKKEWTEMKEKLAESEERFKTTLKFTLDDLTEKNEFLKEMYHKYFSVQHAMNVRKEWELSLMEQCRRALSRMVPTIRIKAVDIPGDEAGIQIKEIDNGEAMLAGLVQYDCILEVQGVEIKNRSHWYKVIRGQQVGKTVTLKISRSRAFHFVTCDIGADGVPPNKMPFFWRVANYATQYESDLKFVENELKEAKEKPSSKYYRLLHGAEGEDEYKFHGVQGKTEEELRDIAEKNAHKEKKRGSGSEAVQARKEEKIQRRERRLSVLPPETPEIDHHQWGSASNFDSPTRADLSSLSPTKLSLNSSTLQIPSPTKLAL